MRKKAQKKVERKQPFTLEDLRKFFAWDIESATLAREAKQQAFDPEVRRQRRAKNKVARQSRKVNRG